MLAFSLMHLNLQNQRSKHDRLVNFLNCADLDTFFSVIAITENWLTPDLCNDYPLPNYEYIVGSGRTSRKGGGVGFYINIMYKFNICSDFKLGVSDAVAESLGVEIMLPGGGKNL